MSNEIALGGVRASFFSAESASDLERAIANGREGDDGGNVRAAIVDATPERLAELRAIVKKGRPWIGRHGLWFSSRGLLKSKGTLCFLFPGLELPYEPHVADVARHFDRTPPVIETGSLEQTGISVMAVGRLLDGVLRRMGLRPDHVAGHSMGEWTALISAGIVSNRDAQALISRLHPGALEVPGVFFAAVGSGIEKARQVLQGVADVTISHDNCPHQVVLCGHEEPLDAALSRLRSDGVICQKLPFQSGFHTRYFADYLAPHRENFASLPMSAATATVWSATTLRPYPREPEGIRALSIEHLVKPVLFRETVLALYEGGARVFVQVGLGRLTQFVEDTLRGQTHLTVSAHIKERGGLEQLVHIASALFVEGADIDVGFGASRRREAQLSSLRHPSLRDEFAQTMSVIAQAERDVFAAFGCAPTRFERGVTTRHGVASPNGSSLKPVARAATDVARKTLVFSLETMPEMLDHTFVRQAPGWPTPSDLQPVVPMTTSLALMIDFASSLRKDAVVVAIENVRAYRWILAAPPTETEIVATAVGDDRLRVRIADACEATIVFAPTFPGEPHIDRSPLADAYPAPESAEDVYERHLLFHGPSFRGIVDSGVLSPEGARGTIEVKPAPGAVLDSAGQLFGYWVISRCLTDSIVFPVAIEKIWFFGPEPRLGTRLTCTVRIRSLDPDSVVANISLVDGERVFCVIEGFHQRRFEADPKLWAMIQWPEKNLLSEPVTDGVVCFEDHYRTAPSRDRLARRFLTEKERGEYERKDPRLARAWLSMRIAAKDAVRNLLWRRHHMGPLFPAEIVITDSEDGPVVESKTGKDVRVAMAHHGDIAVAVAAVSHRVAIAVQPMAASDVSSAPRERSGEAADDRGGSFKRDQLIVTWVES
jgi:malonyl CoA-acyl carrier protein transacylase/phosphopantetheinyl transferase (holo-ACP synthase)